MSQEQTHQARDGKALETLVEQASAQMTVHQLEAALHEWECRKFLRNQNSDLPILLRLAREHGGPVLELGCGTGRVTLELAASGFEVVGLDRNGALLDRLRHKLSSAPQLSPQITLVEADMRDFKLEGFFPLIVAPYNCLCCLNSSAELRMCIRNVRSHLKPGQRFFCQVSAITSSAPHRPDWELLDVDYLEPDGSGPVTAIYSRVRHEGQEAVHIDERYVLFWPGGHRETVETSVRLRSIRRAEIEPLLGAEGLRILHAYGGLDLSPIDPADESVLVYMAEAV
ncbi:MAG TPA: class I SAM-dependent methyltransferase [Candidatus Angelobacter sp.]|nr:class I SAM-dependent methyltransferase [Candidatus Angelobacter sp.]